jgi:hypothetical protein
MILRITGIRKARTRPASSAAAASHSMRARAALENVAAFPAQQQAEELLAGSVAYNPAALQLLAHNTPAWAGHIHRTDRLDQLENQARYSNDLRVRQAEVDLELAADGCQRDSSCVDVLMDHARTNPSSRALALYELGILAGDGVDSARVHPFLLNYARTDSDPAVRQWATEGLRFLGTDEALDELFDIFTHDPSFAVRDRAGCNISDCGIFQSKQRFRMAPRLIDLASDPHLNAQISGWCFMALREITGENLPGDANAWRRWYAANGSAKRAQFEALNWWEVPGDK